MKTFAGGLSLWLVAAVCVAAKPDVKPEDAPPSAGAPRLGPATATRYRVGVVVNAKRGAVRNVVGMVATPLECPEQTVQIASEETTAEFPYELRKLPGQEVSQLLVEAPFLGAGVEAKAIITYDVVTHTILPPEDPSLLAIPKRLDASVKRYAGMSPYITPKHPKIRKAVREALATLEEDAGDDAAEEADEAEAGGDADEDAGAGEQQETAAEPAEEEANAADSVDESSDPAAAAAEPTDWRRIEALYDYVIDKVKYEEGVDKSAVQVLDEGVGDCQAIGALFVAMCRNMKVPARLVWVHDHQYAEFYLVDEHGVGHWFPVETAGTPAFGEMRIARVILQKGDNFRVPERPREALRYATDFLKGLPTPGGGKPTVKYIHEPL